MLCAYELVSSLGYAVYNIYDYTSANFKEIVNLLLGNYLISLACTVAFNHIGAGHYDAVSVLNSQHSRSTLNTPERTPHASNSMCSCGKGEKPNSTSQRCTILKFKYTSTIRCPCFSAGRPCTTLCICHNCCNPKGQRPTNTTTSGKGRKRSKHVWHTRSNKSVEFLEQQQENTTTGPRTLLEYLLISHIIKFCKNNGIDISLDVVHMLYSSCVELVQALEIHVPLGQKTSEEISKVIKEYECNLKVFEKKCVTQLQINTES